MLDKIALILVIIGALNWGGIGIFQFDTVAWLFGGQGAIISRIVYTLVALAGIWTISLLFRDPRRGSYPGLIPLWKSRQNIFPKQNKAAATRPPPCLHPTTPAGNPVFPATLPGAPWRKEPPQGRRHRRPAARWGAVPGCP